MKPAIYIETTIVSYLTAWRSRGIIRQAHELLTQKWWDQASPLFQLVTSDFVIEEASLGDPTAAAKRLAVLNQIPSLPQMDPVMPLARSLELTLSLPARARLDAAHVAMTAVHRVPFLLAWNCKHLANGALQSRIENSCEAFGYKAPRILTPEMLMEVP